MAKQLTPEQITEAALSLPLSEQLNLWEKLETAIREKAIEKLKEGEEGKGALDKLNGK